MTSQEPERLEAGPPAVSSRRTARTFGRKILIFIVVLVVALLFGEIALRLFWTNPHHGEAPEIAHIVRLSHGNSDQIIRRDAIDPALAPVRFRSNDRGYIEPGRRFEKPDWTIAFVGGSTTECMAVEESARFPALVSQLLEAKGKRVNVLNAGKSGNSIHDALRNLVDHIFDDEPDVVVVMHVANDIGFLAALGSYRRQTEARDGAELGLRWALQELSAHSSLAGLARRSATSVTLDARWDLVAERGRLKVSNPWPYVARLRATTQAIRAFGAVPVLMTEPLASAGGSLSPAWADLDAHERFNRLVRQIAAEEGAVLIDLAAEIAKLPGWNQPRKLFYDGMHVTDAGSRAYAQIVAGQLDGLSARVEAARRSRAVTVTAP